MQVAAKIYKVVLEGSKLEENLEAARPTKGFFTTRFIDAQSADLAAQLAVRNLRHEILAELNLEDDSRLLIYVAGVAEIDEESFRREEASGASSLHWFDEVIAKSGGLAARLTRLRSRLNAARKASSKKDNQ